MSTSRLLNSDKPERVATTIGFRFHANDEELEVVSAKENVEVKKGEENLKSATDNSENPDAAKTLGDNSGILPEPAKEQRNLLGKRSISVDSAYESPFSSPIETLKKLNVLKEKLTKTVEEKIFDRNVLSKSSRSRLSHSKDNSSISDSEDTSESSKMSDQWKNAESQTFDKTPTENPETNSTSSEPGTQDIKIVKTEVENKDSESKLRKRKGFGNFSELINVPDIKIATAKSDTSRIPDESLTDVESGVEADENLEATRDSFDLDGFTEESGLIGDSNDPPLGNNIFLRVFGFPRSGIFSQSSTIVILLGFSLYLFYPLSDFLRGFILSFLLMVFWMSIKSYMQLDDPSQQQSPFVTPNYKSMPPLKVPQCEPAKGMWFNEYEKEVYDPDYYSVTQTVPAYLELDNNILKVSRPKGRIQRRATFDEPEYKLPIISQRIYNISGCNVYLMPDGLTRKRLYSKKYPIVIFLRPDSLISEKKHGKDGDEKGMQEDQPEAELEPCFGNRESPKNKCTLYLFARCDRQKEEWYRKLLSAAKHSQKNENDAAEDTDNETEKMPLDDSPQKEPGTPFENLYFDDDVAQVEEYFRYMTNFVHVEDCPSMRSVSRPSLRKIVSKNKKKDPAVGHCEDPLPSKHVFSGLSRRKSKPNGHSHFEEVEEKENNISSGDQVQWLNAFINRILFDVFRSPYWHSKIEEKIYRKLNSIRLPYYVEDIEIIEMDLGKTGPMFHRVSQPYIDERGLWFDMDMTFEGLVRLTIQTHLNLIKLQKGMADSSEAAATSEKQKKGKKTQKMEGESKNSFSIKESKGKPKDSLHRKSKTVSRTAFVTPETGQSMSISEPSKGDPGIVKSPEEMSPEEKPSEEMSPEEKPSEEMSPEEKPPEEKTPEEQSPEEYGNEFIEEVAQLMDIAAEEALPPLEEVDETAVNDADGNPRPESLKDRSPIYDSELEDSAESSDEEEDEEEPPPPPSPPVTEEPNSSPMLPRRYPKNRRSSKKIFKVFENVAQSKYFRSVAQSKYIQKAIAGVSATRLRLTLEIKSCTGILAVNIPPPPSDRFWYGFRGMPELVFSANPKIGDKAVRFVHIKNYLQKKILYEMKKVMVIPNMIDFVLPTSTPGRSLSSLQIEDSDLQETTLSE